MMLKNRIVELWKSGRISGFQKKILEDIYLNNKTLNDVQKNLNNLASKKFSLQFITEYFLKAKDILLSVHGSN